MSMLMLTDISLNSRDVPIIAVTASPRHCEVAGFSKEQISAGVVEALAAHTTLKIKHVHARTRTRST